MEAGTTDIMGGGSGLYLAGALESQRLAHEAATQANQRTEPLPSSGRRERIVTYGC